MSRSSSPLRLVLLAAVVVTVASLAVAHVASAATTVNLQTSGNLDFDSHPFDTYNLVIEQGTIFNIWMDCAAPPNNTLSPMVGVTDPAGNVVQPDDVRFIGTNCGAYWGGWRATYTAPLTGEYAFMATSLNYYLDSSEAEGGSGAYSLRICDAGTCPELTVIPYPVHTNVGRINEHPGATSAIYCRAEGIEVWGIDEQGQGFEVFTEPWDQIEALLSFPAIQSLHIWIHFESSGYERSIVLYLLPSGEFQLVDGPDRHGKTYMFIWDGCPPTRPARIIFLDPAAPALQLQSPVRDSGMR